MAPLHDAAHQRTLSPNVIRNLAEVSESDAMAESAPFEPSSPIATRDFGMTGGVGQFSEKAKVSVCWLRTISLVFYKK